MSIRDILAEIDEDMLLSDGFDDAVIGYAQRCGQPALVVYDRDKCIDVLMKDGMTHEEAEEYFEINVVGAWVGERTPLFLCRVTDA